MCKHDEVRNYIGIGTDAKAATAAVLDHQVPGHHKAFTKVDKVEALEGNAHLVKVTVLGDDTRGDAGLLREHLAEVTLRYPQATITRDKVATRIAELLASEGDETVDDLKPAVLEQSTWDAQCLEDAEAIMADATTDIEQNA